MNEDYYNSEVYSLNNEIYRLNRQLELEKKKKSDKLDPFDNPTEYPDFNGDYSDIIPEIDSYECEIPLEPQEHEYKKIKRFYSIGGWTVLGQFLISNFLGLIIIYVIKKILYSINSGADSAIISEYINSSSILAGINMLSFIVANVGFAFLGLKMAKIPKNMLVRTRNFGFGKAVQYCMAGLFIWTLSGLISAGINDIFVQYGYTTYVMDMDGLATTGTGKVLMTFYSCLIAPLTEEIFFRGMLLRLFSRSNQRFAIFATAFFFGISHHNIPQFVLAFLVGTFLAHITLKHNSIIPAVIVHIFINSISTAFSYLEENINYVVVAVIIVIMTTLGFFMFTFFREKDKIPSTTPKQSRRGIYVAKCSIMFDIAITLQIAYTLALIFM